jgi:inositol phosphorylceramide mannosyltransferase catalytic subunit
VSADGQTALMCVSVHSSGVCDGREYTLWDNDKAADFQGMINRDLFEEEKMWQCKADIMRLEILYKFGGVYIDADMVSLGKPLDAIVDSCKDTGFLIGYEPDTKDKPYSVLGNSFIVASKGHPLLRLLIGYISAIYHHKRPHHTVEWVTGPLACTKALVHTGMPMTVPATELFYPQVSFIFKF